jgi:hypothetical protein
MSNVGFNTAAKTAAELCRHFPLTGESKKLLRDHLTPKQFLDLLLEKRRLPDAARLVAHALPKREAVWWACLCARRAYGPSASPAAGSALQAAERWAADPGEANRRAAQAAADAAGVATPAGCAALAAFFGGGSLAPPAAPAVPPGAWLTAHAASGSVMLAAVLSEPQKAAEKYRTFFALGADVANGANKWK